METRKEFAREMVHLLARPIRQGFSKLYKETRAENKVPRLILREFQTAIKRYAVSPESAPTDVPGAQALARRIARLHLHLTGEKINPDTILQACLLEVAREVWRRPFMFYHGASKMEQQQNLGEFDKLVKAAVKSVVFAFIPLVPFVDALGDEYDEDEQQDGGGEQETTQEPEPTKDADDQEDKGEDTGDSADLESEEENLSPQAESPKHDLEHPPKDKEDSEEDPKRDPEHPPEDKDSEEDPKQDPDLDLAPKAEEGVPKQDAEEDSKQDPKPDSEDTQYSKEVPQQDSEDPKLDPQQNSEDSEEDPQQDSEDSEEDPQQDSEDSHCEEEDVSSQIPKDPPPADQVRQTEPPLKQESELAADDTEDSLSLDQEDEGELEWDKIREFEEALGDDIDIDINALSRRPAPLTKALSDNVKVIEIKKDAELLKKYTDNEFF